MSPILYNYLEASHFSTPSNLFNFPLNRMHFLICETISCVDAHFSRKQCKWPTWGKQNESSSICKTAIHVPRMANNPQMLPIRIWIIIIINRVQKLPHIHDRTIHIQHNRGPSPVPHNKWPMIDGPAPVVTAPVVRIIAIIYSTKCTNRVDN